MHVQPAGHLWCSQNSRSCFSHSAAAAASVRVSRSRSFAGSVWVRWGGRLSALGVDMDVVLRTAADLEGVLVSWAGLNCSLLCSRPHWHGVHSWVICFLDVVSFSDSSWIWRQKRLSLARVCSNVTSYSPHSVAPVIVPYRPVCSRAWTRSPILNSLRVRDTLRIFVRLIPRTAAWEWSSSCSLCSQAWRSVLKTFVMLGVISISSGLYPALIAGVCGYLRQVWLIRL